MKNNNKVNILISVISILLVFSLAEIIMRFAWEMGGWVDRPIYRRSFDPYVRYELVPDTKSGHISINSEGFRGPEYSVVKPKNTFRILMLGDSETFSYLLPYSDSLAAQLEKLLNQKTKSKRYEVLNFGVEGYNTLQELEMLKNKGLKFDPDLIILNYVLNDPEPGEFFFDKSFLMRHSALVRWFSFRFKKNAIKKERKKLNIQTTADHYNYLHQPKYFIHVKNAILEMAQIAQNRGIKLAVVIFPDSNVEIKGFKEDYPFFPLHALVKNIKTDNIITIDLIEEFNRLNLTPELVSINFKENESHKNPKALGVSAEYIYNVLSFKKIIKQE
ncbi:MAG: SGNH/GDSL hydrolase family protein [Candidatus Omnitrophica bacterium]|nr:SGNH/GDSL hydrolase family protein [Candidatus Omnitrophota bacterium]